MLEELAGYDWEEAFKYAGPTAVIGQDIGLSSFSRDDVKRVIALREGENDEESWLGLFELNDGRFAFLSAWCDYTGWG
jgi:hypothetical protein